MAESAIPEEPKASELPCEMSRIVRLEVVVGLVLMTMMISTKRWVVRVSDERLQG